MAAGDGRPQILIVPEQHSHSMERQLCAIGGSRVSLFAEVLSFTRLANRVFSVYGGLAAPALDGGGRPRPAPGRLNRRTRRTPGWPAG